MMKSTAKWEVEQNTKTLSFLKTFIKKLTGGKFQVVHFGWWKAGVAGRYTATITWVSKEEE